MFKLASELINSMKQIQNTISTHAPKQITAPNNFNNYFGNATAGTGLSKIDASSPMSAVNLKTLTQVMAKQEGWFAKGATPNLGQRNNNPGNIRWGKFAASLGATQGEKGFARFSSPEAGFAGMEALLSSDNYKNLTVGQAINRYAPPIENNTNKYIDYVTNSYNKFGI